MKKISSSTWFSIIIFSLVGQIAWTMENMFYNLYIVDEFSASTYDIAIMVASSAIVATLTTLLMGALSDKLKKRKIFIVGGYLIWAIVILSFMFINKKYIHQASTGIILVIIFDCLMTFFGSTANDAAYSAYLTDISDDTNRGKIEGINSAMPLIAILIVFGGLSAFAKIQDDGSDTWYLVFIIVSGLTFLCGILGIFTIKDQKIKTEEKEENYFKNIIYGFRPSVIKNNKTLYIILLSFAIFGISLQIYMPYYILYLQRANISIPFIESIGFDSYIVVMAPAIIIAAIVTILYGRVIDRFGFIKSLIPMIITYLIGLIILSFCSSTIMLFIGCLLMMSGYLASTACYNAVIRKYTPKDKVGLFQGLRIFCSVLIPMLIGPFIGSALSGGGAIFGVVESTFNVSKNIFLGGFIAGLIIIVPLAFSFKELIKNETNQQ